MSTSTTPPAPPAAQDVGGRLEYQLACNRAMFAAGHKAGTGSVFTQAELRGMDWSFTAGLLPAIFVETVLRQRTAAA